MGTSVNQNIDLPNFIVSLDTFFNCVKYNLIFVIKYIVSNQLRNKFITINYIYMIQYSGV